MKLRTEMKDSGYGTIEPRLKLGDNGGAVFHDAARAHALLQAKNEVLANVIYHDLRTLIDIRADSLMREWGFDSGEDA